VAKKLIIETQHRQDRYLLPENCGEIIGVDYSDRRDEIAFVLFEAPTLPSYLRVFALDKPPKTPEEARNLLKRAYTRITYKPVWVRVDNYLYVYPAPVNAGDYLLLTVDEKQGQARRLEFRDSQLASPTEDRREAEIAAQEIRQP